MASMLLIYLLAFAVDVCYSMPTEDLPPLKRVTRDTSQYIIGGSPQIQPIRISPLPMPMGQASPQIIPIPMTYGQLQPTRPLVMPVGERVGYRPIPFQPVIARPAEYYQIQPTRPVPSGILQLQQSRPSRMVPYLSDQDDIPLEVAPNLSDEPSYDPSVVYQLV